MGLFNNKKNQHSDTPRRRAIDPAGRQTRDVSSDVFRRNRTLTGTTSNRFDAANVKSDLESPRAHAHHLATRRRKLSSVLLIVVLSAGLLWALISHFTAEASVSVLDTSLTKSIDDHVYEKAIQEYLDGNPMHRLHFLLDEAALTSYVTNKLPEVAKVSLKGNSGIGETLFIITMRVPVAGWRIADKQYYVDSSGVPFDKNYFAAPAVQIIDNSGAAPQEGAAVASKRFLSFVGRVVSQSKQRGHQVTQAILPPGTTRQLEVKLKSGFLAKLSIDRPVGEQVEDMDRAVDYFSRHGQKPRYIDVRVSGKAFYR